mmetsp:Transcript_32889/g.38175  ORF Transcript_32889/g.38175 Transcript_32889/m.38175 type:complete len:136 (+) Transcript_32889:119-526(+)|eukprot:CAMPEP_0176427960 /NCGR_PEP_ID=MMETSP0127-20121128/12877_1 /TAXON_ID=938130 /ORGANISM="Platyophrya macrostoma, Strain WH" /LENGTH=135 /DNA_ID=CAMNT_0017809575 /DNA_START=127 /DNA_END=534 /DNA_ORIENTATION=-
MEISLNWPPLVGVASLLGVFTIVLLIRLVCNPYSTEPRSPAPRPGSFDDRPLAIPVLEHEAREELSDDCMIGFPLQSALAVPVVTGIIINDETVDEDDDDDKTPLHRSQLLQYPQSDYIPAARYDIFIDGGHPLL